MRRVGALVARMLSLVASGVLVGAAQCTRSTLLWVAAGLIWGSFVLDWPTIAWVVDVYHRVRCRLGRCGECMLLSNDFGIGGKCVRCGKLHGWMTREDLRKVL